ncbi:hypothetical protein [Aureibacter tunicatorum]|uniref:Uncharacterized protein n=1 Tax=Aureibacter tunicatorum TaxID=866807 RepID=A0AAE4BTW2_9BACT|nr:hypothetical protein [Aureibacter tunicatorum]MDR6240072.1 hypothetical protein [Aureibacter tunicatorum]BDD04543.1 hypothetical protein AUTU_20260 [Aureibacter tunicatorum]
MNRKSRINSIYFYLSITTVIVIGISYLTFEKYSAKELINTAESNEHNPYSFNQKFDIEEFESYDQFVDSVDAYFCKHIIPSPQIYFDHNGTKKKIRAAYSFQDPCSEFDCILIRERNIFHINDDSIKISDQKWHLDQLDSIFTLNYYNNGVKPEFSDSHKIMLICIKNSNQSIKKLNDQINKIMNAYEKTTSNKLAEITFLRYPTPEEIESEKKKIETFLRKDDDEEIDHEIKTLLE